MTAGAPIVLAREDRLAALFAPIGGMSRITLAVLAGSAALHLAIVATALVASRTPVVPEQHETAVEVVQEAPKATPQRAKEATANETRKEAAKEAPKETPKLTTEQTAKAPVEQTAKAPVEEPVKETAKADPNPAPSPQPKPAQPTPAQPTPPQPTPPAAARMAPQIAPPSPSAETTAADEREALRKELAELHAQEAKLEARQASADLGMGPLPDSFQAVALPSTTQGAGEAMGYKEIVFSELAKAKGLDDRMGQPGTAGVRFSIDAAGALVDVEVVHPSGVAALDREAIGIVRRAAPFPAPPAGAPRNFTANVSFVVQDRP